MVIPEIVTKSKRFAEVAREEGLQRALVSARDYLDRRLDPVRLSILCIKTRGSTIVREINGSKMRLDIHPVTGDRLESCLALDGVREPESTRTFEHVLKRLAEDFEGPVHVLDVGANVGYFVLSEAKILGERGRIYAVEPDPGNVARMEENVALNEYSGIEILQVAAGAERTQSQLTLRESSNLHRMVDVNEGYDGENVDVEVFPIDRLIDTCGIPRDEILVVRMDTEGYEGEILKGMENIFEVDSPVYIFLEIHPSVPAVDVDDILDRLARGGFVPEYASFDGGRTIRELKAFADIQGIDSNTHVMAKRTPI